MDTVFYGRECCLQTVKKVDAISLVGSNIPTDAVYG
jgi:hypothetical protein